ncbi:uncharacterized protein K489DRAFT_215774 [Dissoconium aciculare CBS 342.82]|uniref:Uncharacterized protein n=1 Tax=Dissoconium aciculare CBS 342.82 TaxID=1314786 RepID=A0A6J3M3Y2_9PEZI|nr:uncharacterized protein K489DRAFT_215774 [Dissoconium aciculare CBS 342.82]KAF1822746.1 hypothetical protein K489DRAFT_215774 [Dissoconium aciculare CBS 342.82]
MRSPGMVDAGIRRLVGKRVECMLKACTFITRPASQQQQQHPAHRRHRRFSFLPPFLLPYTKLIITALPQIASFLTLSLQPTRRTPSTFDGRQDRCCSSTARAQHHPLCHLHYTRQ